MVKTVSAEPEKPEVEKKSKVRVDSIKLMVISHNLSSQFCEANQASQFHAEINKILE
jgi:hypothetical protein